MVPSLGQVVGVVGCRQQEEIDELEVAQACGLQDDAVNRVEARRTNKKRRTRSGRTLRDEAGRQHIRREGGGTRRRLLQDGKDGGRGRGSRPGDDRVTGRGGVGRGWSLCRSDAERMRMSGSGSSDSRGVRAEKEWGWWEDPDGKRKEVWGFAKRGAATEWVGVEKDQREPVGS
jgi:hypothetical protein